MFTRGSFLPGQGPEGWAACRRLLPLHSLGPPLGGGDPAPRPRWGRRECRSRGWPGDCSRFSPTLSLPQASLLCRRPAFRDLPLSSPRPLSHPRQTPALPPRDLLLVTSPLPLALPLSSAVTPSVPAHHGRSHGARRVAWHCTQHRRPPGRPRHCLEGSWSHSLTPPGHSPQLSRQ